MILLALSNPFFTAYSQSDGFGKGIFWGLFLLSLASWTILVYKVWLTIKVKKACATFEKILANKKDEPLQINLEAAAVKLPPLVLNPYLEIYKVLKQKTLEILNKNRFFSEKERSSPHVYLSDSDLQLVESHIASTISNHCKWLEKNLFVLPTIVTLGPFLGLLGTVWGILITFSELNAKSVLGSANSAILSGLSMALATTVLGLLVAIPALIANNYLKTTIKDIRKDMENFSHVLLSSVEMQYRKVDVL